MIDKAIFLCIFNLFHDYDIFKKQYVYFRNFNDKLLLIYILYTVKYFIKYISRVVERNVILNILLSNKNIKILVYYTIIGSFGNVRKWYVDNFQKFQIAKSHKFIIIKKKY